MIVSARTPSTPARCHSQDGMRRHTAGAGNTRIPRRRGPGRLGPELGQQDPPRPVRLQDHDLLLQDRGHQRLHQPPGPPQPEPWITAGRVGDQRMAGGVEPGHVVIAPERSREARQQPAAPPAPTPAPAPASTRKHRPIPGPNAPAAAPESSPAPRASARSARSPRHHRPDTSDPRAPGPAPPESPGRRAHRAPATQPRASAHPYAAPTRPIVRPASAQTRAIRRVEAITAAEREPSQLRVGREPNRGRLDPRAGPDAQPLEQFVPRPDVSIVADDHPVEHRAADGRAPSTVAAPAMVAR